MKIFGNCLVKNEGDMIVETLVHAARWCDRIFVFDNGSTDDTWAKVLELAQREPRVVPFKSAAVPYRDSLRMDTFNAFRHECADGDWWCKLDADELYHDDPRAFLAAVPHRHHVVWGVNFQFYFTDRDAARWASDSRAYPPHTPAEQALRYYRCDYAEVRFFRYRRGLVWDHGSAPRHLGVVHPRRIRFKHYQYRSPEQINLRLRTRQKAMADGCGTFQGYCDEHDWREKVVSAATCHSMDAPDPLRIEERIIPRHLERPWQRAMKLALHGTGIWP
ncbi:MAG: glycosyl transferase family 2 [Opitutus sp.]|nr:glycosyl transferase family 2 [Opitutus sp.]